MDKNNIINSAWYRALSLEERLQCRHLFSKEPSSQAYKRLQSWQAKVPFNNDDVFNAFLQTQQITEQDLLYLFDLSPTELAQGYPQALDWVLFIFEIFQKFSNKPLPNNLEAQIQETFLVVIRPLIVYAYDELQSAIASTHSLLFSSEAFNHFYQILCEDFKNILTPVMLLELHSAKMLNMLKGETSQERFLYFIRQFNNAEKSLEFLQEYPSLARKCVIYLKNWLDGRIQFIQHLVQDWATIGEKIHTFKGASTILNIVDDLSDPHCKGKRVFVIEDINHSKIVYKPRSLQIDVHFSQFLNWLEQNGLALRLRNAQVWNRDDYGWVEFIEYLPCETPTQITNFYQRLGYLIAIFYLLRGTDAHNGNLIACGEYPIPIDLETLFHNQVPYDLSGLLEGERSINKKFFSSVITTLFLPAIRPPNIGQDFNGVVDIAAGVEVTRLVIENEGSDEMRYVRKKITLENSADINNQPLLLGQPVNPLDYVDDIIYGFTEVYNIFETQQKELLSDNNILSLFENDHVRVLFRNTQTYCHLIRQTSQAQEARDGLVLERTLDSLWGKFGAHPHFAHVVPLEKEDIINLDVPLFTSTPNSCTLWNSQKTKGIPNFFERSALSLIKERIQQLGEIDLKEQLWLIRASFACTKKVETVTKPEQISIPTLNQAEAINNDDYITCIQEVEKLIQKNLVLDYQDITCLTIASSYLSYFITYRAYDLLSGMPGVAIFYASLGQKTGDEKLRKLAKQLIKSIWVTPQVNTILSSRSLGAYEGVGGKAYIFAYLGCLWQDKELIDQACQWLQMGEKLIEQPKSLDIVSGLAGYLLATLNIQEICPERDFSFLMEKCGKKLLQLLQIQENAPWHPPSAYQLRPGFAQGWAGIAYVLFKLADKLQQPVYAKAADIIVEYEQNLIAKNLLNASWVDGWAGLLLVYLNHPKMKNKIDLLQAQKTITQQFYLSDHSLGYGEGGLIESLLALHADNPDQTPFPSREIYFFIQQIKQKSLKSPFAFDIFPIGMLQGLAGVGYTLLRLMEPTSTPSVLLLELPQKKLNPHQETLFERNLV